MERVKKRLLAACSVMVGMTVVMAIGFWTLRANAMARANVNIPVFRAMLPVEDSSPLNTNRPVSSPLTPSAPASLPAPVTTPISVTKISLAPPPVTAPPVEEHAGILNLDRQFALGMIETANDDTEIGRAGEVSRYQIMPAVWRHYSNSRQYRNPEVSLRVARQHWLSLYQSFKRVAHREPTDFDMYVLWNTSFNYYASKSWQPASLSPVVRDRARRFANLVERGNT